MNLVSRTLTSLAELEALGLEIQPHQSGYHHQLERYLQERHLTASDLAKLTGMSRQNVSAILSYKVAPSIVVALKIATILNRPVEELFSLTENAWVMKAKVNDRALFIDHLRLMIVDSTERTQLERTRIEPIWVHIQTREEKPRRELSREEVQSGDWRPRFEPLVRRLTPIIAG